MSWVEATRRLSRRLLLDLLEFTGAQLHTYLATRNLHEDTTPISWASNQPAPMWLQIARELTEYWMHHQYICETVAINSLTNQRFLTPILTTFAHAFPRAYAFIAAPVDTVINFGVTDEVETSWDVIKENDHWALYADTDLIPTSIVKIPVTIAWKVFTKGITSSDAEEYATIEGDIDLGRIALNTVAILA